MPYGLIKEDWPIEFKRVPIDYAKILPYHECIRY